MAATNQRIKVYRIDFTQLEGPTGFCRQHVFGSWALANEYVRETAVQAPGGTAFWKCDVRIMWANQASWGFQYEMTRYAAETPFPLTLAAIDELRLHGGLYPGELSRAAYKEFLATLEQLTPGNTNRAKRILNLYDLGVAA